MWTGVFNTASAPERRADQRRLTQTFPNGLASLRFSDVTRYTRPGHFSSFGSLRANSGARSAQRRPRVIGRDSARARIEVLLRLGSAALKHAYQRDRDVRGELNIPFGAQPLASGVEVHADAIAHQDARDARCAIVCKRERADHLLNRALVFRLMFPDNLRMCHGKERRAKGRDDCMRPSGAWNSPKRGVLTC